MLKFIPLLIFLLAPNAFAFDALTIYRALQVAPKEQCHNTEACPNQYVQAKTVGGLICVYIIRSEAMSPVSFDCRLGRRDHEAIFEALKVAPQGDRSYSQKSVGGLVCQSERSFWGGSKVNCELR